MLCKNYLDTVKTADSKFEIYVPHVEDFVTKILHDLGPIS